ncbi:MAG: hypothetical protein Fur0037_14870 [Planctomycetota bacterium]
MSSFLSAPRGDARLALPALICASLAVLVGSAAFLLAWNGGLALAAGAESGPGAESAVFVEPPEGADLRARLLAFRRSAGAFVAAAARGRVRPELDPLPRELLPPDADLYRDWLEAGLRSGSGLDAGRFRAFGAQGALVAVDLSLRLARDGDIERVGDLDGFLRDLVGDPGIPRPLSRGFGAGERLRRARAVADCWRRFACIFCMAERDALAAAAVLRGPSGG